MSPRPVTSVRLLHCLCWGRGMFSADIMLGYCGVGPGSGDIGTVQLRHARVPLTAGLEFNNRS